MKARRAKLDGSLKPSEHKEELDERANFLLFGNLTPHIVIAIDLAFYKLTAKDLNLLWDFLVSNPASSDDPQIFYKLLNHILKLRPIEQTMSVLSDATLFMTATICGDKTNFQTLPIDGMKAIEAFILGLNRALRNIRDAPKTKHSLKVAQIVPGEDLDREKGTIIRREDVQPEFVVTVSPGKLLGVDALWKIVLEARSEDVTLKAIELLNELYTKLAEELEDSIAEISGQFVASAVEKLKVFQTQIVKEGQNRGREIVKLLKLIEQMLDESERKGNFCITPFHALNRGTQVNVTILNYAIDTVTHSIYPEKITLSAHSKVTFYQLKTLIAATLNLHPESVSLLLP